MQHASGPSSSTTRCSCAKDSAGARRGRHRRGRAVRTDADSFLATLPEQAPDVVVMDVRMPPTFTDEACPRRRHDATPGTTHRRPPALPVRRGAGPTPRTSWRRRRDGHRLPAEGPRHPARGDRRRRPSHRRRRHGARPRGRHAVDEPAPEPRSSRHPPPAEREVLGLMAEGRTNAAIARALVIGTAPSRSTSPASSSSWRSRTPGEDHRRVLAVLAYLGLMARP